MRKRKLAALMAIAIFTTAVPQQNVQAYSLGKNMYVETSKTEEESLSETMTETVESEGETNEDAIETETDIPTETETDPTESMESDTEETETKEPEIPVLPDRESVPVKEQGQEEKTVSIRKNQDSFLGDLTEHERELYADLKERYPDVTRVSDLLFQYTDESGSICTVDLDDPELIRYLQEEEVIREETSYSFHAKSSANSYNERYGVSPFTGGTYDHGEQNQYKEVFHGIDVSAHQKTINWAQVKSAGVEFAFIRIGYRGYEKGTLNEDTYALENLRNAYNAGIKIGVYYFSQAINEQEAKKEAGECIRLLSNYGMLDKVTLPIVIDYEYAGGNSGRLKKANLSASAHQSICNAFGAVINGAGKKTAIYANYNMLKDDMVPNSAPSYMKYWIARYNNSTGYTNPYEFWQYSSKGRVSGINGYVDCNFWYRTGFKNVNEQSVRMNMEGGSDYVSLVEENLTIYDTEYQRALLKGVDINYTIRKKTDKAYEVVITGLRNENQPVSYTGTTTRIFVLKQMEMHKTMVADIPDQIYTGEAITTSTGLKVVVTHDGSKLVEGQDYRIDYSNNVGVGTATVRITGMGNYKSEFGTVTKTFRIIGKPIKERWVSQLKNQYFVARPITTKDDLGLRVVTDDGTVLIEGKDYSVTYKSNKAVGTATVTVNGIGEYSGSIVRTFQIGKLPLTDETGKLTEDLVISVGGVVNGTYTASYTGNAIKPEVKIWYKGIQIGTTNYQVKYSRNVSVSDRARIDIVGVDRIKGSYTCYFTISEKKTAKKITGDMVNVQDNFYTPKGEMLTPDAVVTVNRKRLVRGTDYEVTYQQVINGTKRPVLGLMEQGVYYLNITGKGEYTGKVVKKVTVRNINYIALNSQNIQVTVTGDAEGITYTGKIVKPKVVVTLKNDSDTQLVEGVDYKLAYSGNKKAGTAKYTLTGMGNYRGVYTGTFTIQRKDIGENKAEKEVDFIQGDLRVWLNKYQIPYTGTSKEVTVNAMFGNTKLVRNRDFVVKYQSKELKNSGNYPVTVEFIGDLKGSVELNYQITPVDVEKLKVVIPKQYYQGCAAEFSIESTEIYLGSVKLTKEDCKGLSFTGWSHHTEVSGSGQAYVNLVASSDSNFISGSKKEIAFQIFRRKVADQTLEFTVGGKPVKNFVAEYEVPYDGQKHTPQVQIKHKESGINLVEGRDYTLTYESNRSGGNAKITVTGLGQYVGKAVLTFKIKGIPFEQNGEFISGFQASLWQNGGMVTDATYSYNGTAKKPMVVLKKNGTKLTNGVHYKVSYENNINAGTATVRITGMGNYSGTVKKTFKINPKTRAQCSRILVTVAKEDFVYSGKVVEPKKVNVVVDGVTLVQGKDFTFSVINSYRIGQTQDQKQPILATVLVTGVGNYSGKLGKRLFLVRR